MKPPAGQHTRERSQIGRANQHTPILGEKKGKVKMNKIEACLTEIGIPANLKGFGYLCDAIQMASEDKTYLEDITKRLYPDVAKKYPHATGSRAERAMRHAIEVAFNRTDSEKAAKYFGNAIDPERGKPTNSQFIAGLVLFLRDDTKEEA